MRRVFRFSLALNCLFSLALSELGCSGDDSQEQVVSCESDARADAYADHLSKTSASGRLTITLNSGTPAPPSRGDNSWTIRVTDAAGMPLSDRHFTVSPFMPDHGHGTAIKPIIVSRADGIYEVTRINFFMGGLWRVTIADVEATDPADAVEFVFCVAG